MAFNDDVGYTTWYMGYYYYRESIITWTATSGGWYFARELQWGPTAGYAIRDCHEYSWWITDLTAAPAIQVIKEVSVDSGATWQDASTPPGPSLPSGTDPRFRFTVTNTGNVALTNLTLTDSDFSTASCTIPASLAPTGQYACTITAPWAAGQHTDTATASGAFGATPYSDTDDANYFGEAPGLSLTKLVTSAGPYDTVGDLIAYQLVAANTGNVGLTGVMISDPLLGALACVPAQPAALAVGATLTCTGNYAITQTDFDNGSVSNSATAVSSETSPQTAGTTTNLTQTPALTLTKSITSGSPYSAVGDVIVYSYDVQNTGNVTLDEPFAVVDDRSTDEACPAAMSLAPGASILCTASYTVTAPDVTSGSVTNSAYATGSFSGGVVTSNTDQATAVGISDPGVTKTGDPATAAVGDTVTFTLVVRNNGTAAADNVTLSDPIPLFLDIVLPVTVVPAIPPGNITVSMNLVTVSFGTLNPSQTYTVTITTVVNSLGAPPGGTNSATVSTTSADSDPNNNADSALVTIVTGGAAPATGFAPDRITPLPAQPESCRYADLGDLWIEIPKLGVKMTIVGVPLIEDGWDVTWLGSQAGYLYGTAFPTWKGNSVITSHVMLASGRAGPFRNLKNLHWDDTVIVRYAGQRYVYSVRSSSAVMANDASIFRHEERPWLTLVTCGGYDAKRGEYRYRIAVKAVLMSIEPEP